GEGKQGHRPDPSKPPQADGGKAPGEGEKPSLSEAIRELERVAKSAKDRRALGKQLQDAARKLADGMSDEEKRQLAEQLAKGGGSGGWPGGEAEGRGGARDAARFDGHEDVDLRGRDEPDRTVAEWIDPTGGDTPATSAAASGPAAVRRAAQQAEQAVEKA